MGDADRTARHGGETSRRLAVGDRVGRYRLERVLGEGGMGVVFAARDPDLERDIALKLILGSDNDLARARLLREARAMAQVAHRNVITVFEVGSAGDRDFIAMELIDGSSLDVWLCATRTLHEILEMFAQASNGLEAAHAKGLVHRDFKPHNVLVGLDGRVVVTDFGIASSSEHAPAPATGFAAMLLDATWQGSLTRLTATGAVLGSPAYMAPEQWAGAADQRSDQFAFCVALWEAVAGRRPFAGGTAEQLRAAVEAGPPATAPKLPGWLLPILRRGLAANPADRWPSLAALGRALLRGRHRRRRGFLALGATLVLAGAAAGVHALASTSPSPTVEARDDVNARISRDLAKLMTLPTEPGNGCADYFELIEHPVDLGIQWKTAISDASRPRLAQLASDPEVRRRMELLRAGARKPSCEIIGVLVPWPTAKDPLAIPVPNMTSVLQHAAVIRFEARTLAASGDLAAATSWLETLVLIGWQLQQEPLLVIDMLGVMVFADSAEQLSDLLASSEIGGRWRALSGRVRNRRYDENVDLLTQTTLPKLDQAGLERLASIVDSPGLLFGTRIEAMMELSFVHLLHAGSPAPSGWQRAQFQRWMAAEPRVAAAAAVAARTLDLTPDERVQVGRQLHDDIAEVPAP